MRRLALPGSLCVALALNVSACGDDDDSSGNEGFSQTGGSTTGGYATTGGSATGGVTSTTGGTTSTTGGATGTTGGATGTTGGATGTTGGATGTTGGATGTTGGATGTTGGTTGTTGGASAEAGAAGMVPVAGNANEGGSANVAGSGGAPGTTGGAQGAEAGAGGAGACSGYVSLLVAFEAQGDVVELPISLGEAPVDLSATAVAIHLKVLEPNAGGMQVFAKNGEALQYKSVYAGWTELVASPEWQDLTLNLAEVPAVGTGGAGGASSQPVFDKSQVATVGLQVTTGDATPFSGGATILLDAVTFSDHPELNVDFTAQDENLKVSACGTVCDNSSVTWQKCE
jgi:hypothetical protein